MSPPAVTHLSPKPRPAKVFVSYSHKDEALANALRERLVASGVDVWASQFDLLPGDDIRDAVRDAIADSDAVVPILSRNTYDSDWASIELATALASAASSQRPRIVPVLADSDASVPPMIADLTYADASDREHRDQAFDDVVNAITLAPKISETEFAELRERKAQLDAETALLVLRRHTDSLADFEQQLSRYRAWSKAVLSALLFVLLAGGIVGTTLVPDLMPVVTGMIGAVLGGLLVNYRRGSS